MSLLDIKMPGFWSAWRGGDERRRESRQAVPRLVVESTALEVEVVDASDSGLGVEAERPLRIGVIYPFRLRRGDQVSEVYGLVRWCRTGGADRFRAGVSVNKTIGPPLSRFAS